MRIGLQIRALRRRAGLTQGELGARVHLSASAICRLERGRAARATVRMLEQVVEAVGGRLVISIQWQGEALDRLMDKRAREAG